MEYVKDFDTVRAGVLLDRIKTRSLYQKRKHGLPWKTRAAKTGKYSENTMIAVLQRVKNASVSVDGKQISAIDAGLLVLLGVADTDEPKDISHVADKVVNLRIFADEQGKMNKSLADTGGQMLVVSQFTLLGDCRKGRRPSFVHAADPQKAESFYLEFAEHVRQKGIDVQTGQFQAMMDVSLVNDGPVTLTVESRPGS